MDQFHSCIEKYAKIVEQFPEHIAIIEKETSLSHTKLWERAKYIQWKLHQHNIRGGDIIGVYIEKSTDVVASMLACWMQGAVYLPLDPTVPKERLLFYCRDAQPKVILHKEHILDWQGTHIFLAKTEHHSTIEECPITPDTPAYLLYSSGSTGTAKGILVGHSGVHSVLQQQIDLLQLHPNDRCLWWLSMQFDASISDIGVSLLSGACLVIDHREDIVQTMRKYEITYADIPPVYLVTHQGEQFPPCLSRILIGGEICPLDRVRQHLAHRSIVVVYGPTEATICSSMIRYEKHSLPTQENTMGFPLQGVEYLLQDGELWIGGQTLAIGYWNRPDLAEKWIYLSGKRYFCTADIVEQNEDASYKFLGRKDRQFKIHGKLVAPEEIEQHILSHTKAKRVIVTKKQSLCAFIETPNSIDYQACIRALQEHLPDWMIPKYAQIIAQFPETSSGKVDIPALYTYIEVPNTDSLWIRLFSKVLGIPCTEHSNFFALGGDSIATLLLLTEAQRYGKQITPEILKRYPTPVLLETQAESNHGIYTSALIERFPITKKAPRPLRPLQDGDRILLTGATGFLGSTILPLLIETPYTVRVLVRAKTWEDAYQRIPCAYRDRIEIVLGDISNPMDVQRFVHAATGRIINCAANISLTASLEEIYPSNVGSVQWLSQTSLDVVQISTLAIFLSSDLPRGILREEPISDMVDHKIYGGYAQSKWLAEKETNFHSIIRLGLLVDTQRVHHADLFVSFIRGICKLSCIPLSCLEHVCLDMTDISYASQAIVDIALHPSGHGVFHIASKKSVAFRTILNILREIGYSITDCSIQEFWNYIEQHPYDIDIQMTKLATHTALTGKKTYQQYDIFLATSAQFDDTRIAEILQRHCPVPDQAYIRKIVSNILQHATI